MFKDQMQQDVIMVLKFPSNSPVTHVAANTLPHLTIPAVVTVTCSRLFAVNRWHNTVGRCAGRVPHRRALPRRRGNTCSRTPARVPRCLPRQQEGSSGLTQGPGGCSGLCLPEGAASG